MELLQEAKNGNKQSYKELTAPIEIKLYKTARLYFKQEPEVLNAVKYTLKELYKEIVNVKTEEMLIVWAVKILIKYSNQKVAQFSKSRVWKKKYDNEKYQNEYQLYRRDSIVEQYITSMKPEHRLITVLYFYDEISTKNIAWILKKSNYEVIDIVDKSREELIELITNEGVKKYNDYV